MIMVALLGEVQGTANRGPPCDASRNPGGQKNLKNVGFGRNGPLQPKSPLLHLITIENMKFAQKMNLCEQPHEFK